MDALETNVYVDQILDVAKSILDDRQYDVLVSRTLHNITLVDLGKEYGRSPERMRQIEAKALRKVREHFAKSAKAPLPMRAR